MIKLVPSFLGKVDGGCVFVTLDRPCDAAYWPRCSKPLSELAWSREILEPLRQMSVGPLMNDLQLLCKILLTKRKIKSVRSTRRWTKVSIGGKKTP